MAVISHQLYSSVAPFTFTLSDRPPGIVVPVWQGAISGIHLNFRVVANGIGSRLSPALQGRPG